MHRIHRKAISPNSVVLLFFIACIASCATTTPTQQVFMPSPQPEQQQAEPQTPPAAPIETPTDTITAAGTEEAGPVEALREARRQAALQKQHRAQRRQKKARVRMAAKKHTPAPITDNTSARLSKPLPSAETQRLAMLKPTEAAELADLQDAAMAVASEATAAMAMAAAQQNTAALVTEGSAVYYVPKQMTELQTTTVTLWIDADSSLQQLVNEFASTLNLEAATVSAHKLKIAAGSDAAEDKRIGNIARTRLLVTDIMHAELSGGSEFTIRPHGKIKQSLSNTGRAKWPWQVTPNLAADSAELRINVWIDPTGTGTLTESYSNVIRVYPKPQSWSDKLYQLLSDINAWLALLGIGGIGVILPFIYRRFAGKHQGADG